MFDFPNRLFIKSTFIHKNIDITFRIKQRKTYMNESCKPSMPSIKIRDFWRNIVFIDSVMPFHILYKIIS